MEQLTPELASTQHVMLRDRMLGDEGEVRRGLVYGVAGAVAVVAIGGAYWLGSRNGESSPATSTATAESPVAGCDALEFKNAASDATLFNSEAFLPKNSVGAASEVQSAIDSLFKATPLGNNGDLSSLAAVNAIITDRATNAKNAVDPNYDYVAAFKRNRDAFNGVNGLQAGKDSCKATFGVFNQVAQYNDAWASKGEALTAFIAIRNDKNEIIDLKLKKEVASGTLAGTEFKFRTDAKGIVAGFPSVLETSDGVLYVKGFAAGAESDNPNGEPTPTPSTSTTPSPQPSPNAGNNGNSQNPNAGNGGTTGPGETTGPGNGGGNTGPSPSGPGGNGGGTPTGTPTTPGGGETPTPKPSTGTPTPKPTPTPTKTPTPTPTPSTPTPTPKGSEPTCVPNPPYVIC